MESKNKYTDAILKILKDTKDNMVVWKSDIPNEKRMPGKKVIGKVYKCEYNKYYLQLYRKFVENPLPTYIDPNDYYKL